MRDTGVLPVITSKGIPTSMAAYPDHRPAQPPVVNASFENRVESRINASLDVVRMALMTTFREELEGLRAEIAYLREQSRANQENWERTFSFLRQYVPPEVWDQHGPPSLAATAAHGHYMTAAAPGGPSGAGAGGSSAVPPQSSSTSGAVSQQHQQQPPQTQQQQQPK